MHKNDAQVVYGSCDTFDCLIVEQLENINPAGTRQLLQSTLTQYYSKSPQNHHGNGLMELHCVTRSIYV